VSKVSVIIPAYNQGNYLREAIQSVLDQTYPNYEIIIVDDGSTDHTCEVAHEFSDDRVMYFYQANRGLSGARNTGIRHATGDYLSYLDSDDKFTPEKLAYLVKELEDKPDIGLVAGQAIPINEDGFRVGKTYNRPIPEIPQQLLLGNPLHVGSVLIRRTWQEIAGDFDETLRSYEDWDMWLRLVKLGCLTGWVPKPVSLYRFHTQQMTRNSRQMTEATFSVLDKFFDDPDLTEEWLDMKDRAYSSAHLRATASYYQSKEYASAQKHLVRASELDPDLLANNAEPLARRLSAFINSPKITNPLQFLENIYAHLPDELEVLRKQSKYYLSETAIQQAFEAYEQGEMRKARQATLRAVRYRPGWLGNRGVFTILIRSIFDC
jgi:glycosyltransferase involved in cell wall biosynthesis